jgi:hypothetical protein
MASEESGVVEAVRSTLAMVAGVMLSSCLWAIVTNATRGQNDQPGGVIFDTTSSRAYAMALGLGGVALVVLELIKTFRRSQR